MTTTTTPRIQDAIAALAATRDHILATNDYGFNAGDVSFFYDLALRGIRTYRQAMAAYRILRTYRVQLRSIHGIDYDAIPAPDPAQYPEESRDAKRAAPKRHVSLVEAGVLRLAFDYDAELVSAIKTIPGRRWDPSSRSWTVPIRTPDAVERVAALVEGWDQEEAAAEALQRARDTLISDVAASEATDAEGIEIPGLGGELLPFQRGGVAYLRAHPHAFLADEMGLGKTVQALAAAEDRGAYPVLVVCPASLVLNWVREAQRWLPHRSVACIHKDHPEVDIAVTSYDTLAVKTRAGRKNPDTGRYGKPTYGPRLQRVLDRGYPTVIVDEAHYIKSPRANRTIAVTAALVQAEVRWLLTGTPVLNRPSELITPLQSLGFLGTLGGWKRYVTRYCAARQTRWGWDISGASHTEELAHNLRALGFVRRLKSDVLRELPAKRRAVVPVTVPNAVLAQVHEALREVRGDVDTATVLAALTRAREIAGHAKIPMAIEWIQTFLDGSDESLVVFAHHREVQRQLAEAFPDALAITGDMDEAARQSAVDAFQAGSSRLILCSLKAAGVGLTLTRASNVLFTELDWVPANLDQAEDRCHRIGQHDSVTAYYLIAEDTLDAHLWAILEEKRQVSESITAPVYDDLVQRLAS